jgi:hypothetical protein
MQQQAQQLNRKELDFEENCVIMVAKKCMVASPQTPPPKEEYIPNTDALLPLNCFVRLLENVRPVVVGEELSMYSCSL